MANSFSFFSSIQGRTLSVRYCHRAWSPATERSPHTECGHRLDVGALQPVLGQVFQHGGVQGEELVLNRCGGAVLLREKGHAAGEQENRD